MIEADRIKQLEHQLQKAESHLEELIAECYGIEEGIHSEGTLLGAIQNVRELYRLKYRLKTHISPEFLIAVINSGVSKDVCYALAQNIPSSQIFQSVHRGEISPREGSEIIMMKRKADSFGYKLFKFLKRLFL